MTNRFQQGSGVYVCRSCEKATRETGEGESSVLLCLACYTDAGFENEHNDGYHAEQPEPECPFCETPPAHVHLYRPDLADWFCETEQTATDHCSGASKAGA